MGLYSIGYIVYALLQAALDGEDVVATRALDAAEVAQHAAHGPEALGDGVDSPAAVVFLPHAEELALKLH